MFFLMRYNRKAGRIVTMERFDDLQKELAQRARIELEVDLNRRQIADEVVILQAVDEEALRRTHGRYFQSVLEILRRTRLVVIGEAP